MTHINKITLLEVYRIPIGMLATLPSKQLLLLREQAEENLQRAKLLKLWLDSSISLKQRNASLVGYEEVGHA